MDRLENIDAIEDKINKYIDQMRLMESDKHYDEQNRLIRVAIYRVARFQLEDFVNVEHWLQPPFPEYNDGQVEHA
jgi:hypothetical protein